MSTGLYSHTTRGTGTILTSAIYNGDHVNHVTNQNPEMTGAYSDDVSEFQDTFDPGTIGNENLPGNLAEELGAIRFMIQSIHGGDQWYEQPSSPVGIGDVAGPDGGVADEEYALFDGTSGKAIQGGKTSADAAAVWAATPNRVLETDQLETGAAFMSLTDAATVAMDWDGGINRTLELTANRVLGNPTNGQPGTSRRVLVDASSSTERTLTFGNQYGGTLPSLDDITDTQMYLLTIFCVTATKFLVTAIDASDA